MTDYKPYGKEWEAEMMRLTKRELIEFIRSILWDPEKDPAIDIERRRAETQ